MVPCAGRGRGAAGLAAVSSCHPVF